MEQAVELLAPGGDLDSIKAAICAGADAIYCGLDNFNARQRAENLAFDDFCCVIKLAHQHQCKIFLTINIVVLEHELPPLVELLNKLVNTAVDAVIVQDLGLFYLLSEYFPSLEVHASTQVTTHNEGQVQFLKALGVRRVNLSRELNAAEVKALVAAGHQLQVESEVFVHGSYCVGFSGACYISSAYGGNSGNRGRCSQPCRDQYQTTKAGNDYPLNLKDNSAFSDLSMLLDAKVDSLKIEGRIKKAPYVYTTVSRWRKQLERVHKAQPLATTDDALYKVFNRDFSAGFLRGEIGGAMFIDNPRDHSIDHFSARYTDLKPLEQEQAVQALFDEKAKIAESVEQQVATLKLTRTQLLLKVAGIAGAPLAVSVFVFEQGTPAPGETEAQPNLEVRSQSLLRASERAVVDRSVLEKRFKGISGGGVELAGMDLSALDTGLSLPFKELTEIKQAIARYLNGGRALHPAITWSDIGGAINKKSATNSGDEQLAQANSAPRLSVLVDSTEDARRLAPDECDLYYKLPEAMAALGERHTPLFLENRALTPWFPSILIGEDYHAALAFLDRVNPERIVTNNTGIAFQAFKRGIDWVAGPYLNLTNTLSLHCLKQRFNCEGAFISNELNKLQIKRIQAPENFALHYSIYYPNLLLTSRQCLFFQTTGCHKTQMDEKCLPRCQRHTQITHTRGDRFLVDKQRGGYSSLYGAEDFLNTEIVEALTGKFTSFFIDLSDRATSTQAGALGAKTSRDKCQLIDQFQRLLKGEAGSTEALHQMISPSTCAQYGKGL